MRLLRKSFVILIAVVTTMTSQSIATTHAAPATLEPTQVLRIIPAYGYSPKPIRLRFSRSEIQIMNRLQVLSTTWIPDTPVLPLPAVFLIEPSAENSETIRLGIKAMTAVASLLVRPFDSRPTRTYVIIGRTQEFLKSKVEQVGCTPDLRPTGGNYLMGATLCDRQVVVINLTGYLFLKSRNNVLTPDLETLPEPPISATSYLIADRNIAGLAHEWVHVSRAQNSRGLVPDNEPAWMREGLAEVVSGMARVKASEGRMRYHDFHAIRLRKFIQWPPTCAKSLSAYRGNSESLGGCEYHRGAVAVELLIANYGGLNKIIRLYNEVSRTGDFFASFKTIYKMSIDSFEMKADRYARYISQAATYAAVK